MRKSSQRDVVPASKAPRAAGSRSSTTIRSASIGPTRGSSARCPIEVHQIDAVTRGCLESGDQSPPRDGAGRHRVRRHDRDIDIAEPAAAGDGAEHVTPPEMGLAEKAAADGLHDLVRGTHGMEA